MSMWNDSLPVEIGETVYCLESFPTSAAGYHWEMKIVERPFTKNLLVRWGFSVFKDRLTAERALAEKTMFVERTYR